MPGTRSNAMPIRFCIPAYSNGAVTVNQYLTEAIVPFTGRVGAIKFSAQTAGTGVGTYTVIDVLKNGTSIFNAVTGAPVVAPTAGTMSATASANASSQLGTGAYQYKVTFVNAVGETEAGPAITGTTTGAGQQLALANIPTGGTGTTARNLYRSVVGNSTAWSFLAQLADNTTTAYTDLIADSALGIVPAATMAQTSAPTVNTTNLKPTLPSTVTGEFSNRPRNVSTCKFGDVFSVQVLQIGTTAHARVMGTVSIEMD